MGCRVAGSSKLLTSCLASVAGILGGVGGSLFFGRQSEQAPQQPERIVCKELQLESLVLVDRDGKQIGWMGASGDSGATLMLGRGEGRPMVVLQIDEIEGTPSALLSVAAPEPVPPPAEPAPASASINCSSGQPRLCLITASGRRIELGSTTEDPEATLSVGRLGEGEKTKWPK